MAKLKYANALIRLGKYREALEMFSELYQSNPYFSPYRAVVLMGLKLLGMNTEEIDAYMSLDRQGEKRWNMTKQQMKLSLKGNFYVSSIIN